MKATRFSIFIAFAVILIASSTWAISRPPADAVLLFRDGHLITGDVFTVNDHTVSMLTEYGIQSYKRKDVSQLVFLEHNNAMVLRAEGRFVDELSTEGDLYYVGGIWDGRPAGTFTSHAWPESDEPGAPLIGRINLDIWRNGLPRGTISTINVFPADNPPVGIGDYVFSHGNGIILGGTGDYEDCVGTFETMTFFDGESSNPKMVSYGIFRFDDVH